MRCWVARWQMSNALERGDLAVRLGRGHISGCAACQAFGASLGALHARLSAGAHAAPAPIAVARRPRWPWLVAGSLAAGGAAALALVTAGGPVTPAIEPSPPGVQLTEPVVHVRRVADRVAQALATTPLETELDDLIYDSRRGLDAVLAAGSLRR
jgi:hypothetical protein